ncbi:hypothetical protein [Methanothrix soehngenii]|jgi:hypothetical protein|uniref:hypothetical protein n=1 Tax=Methanothrix soehngenii TaxID=2223 RepID=UPI002D0538DD|nr:hypothetical protein [Methanothrix soehngenii]HNZ05687.1 hypothetical protein [Methanothrix soehngenii]
MKEFSVRTGRLLGIYALVLGVGYGAQALAETIGGRESFPGGILSIAVLLVISATYLMGAKSLVAGRREGLSFLMGGLFLSGAVGGLYLLMTGADWLMYLLGEVEDFAVLSEISPATVLLIVALPLVPMMRKMTRGMAW